MKITAILAARNESMYLPRLLKQLAADDVELVYLDNESTDGSVEIAKSFSKKQKIHIDSIKYEGFFDLTRQLQAKQEWIDKIDSGWVIHIDADEI